MPEEPANPNVNPQYSPFWFRVLEILPGASVWIALISPFILSVYYPLQVTLFIIIFDVYWLLKALRTALILYIGYKRMQRNLRIDWSGRIEKLSAMDPGEREAKGYLDPGNIYHAVIFTTYKEEQAILESSINSLVNADYNPNRLILVLATEERDAANVRQIAADLQEKYRGKFFRFIVTEHPDGIVGEVKGKGANAAWAAKILTKQVAEENIPFDQVIVSTADADSRFPKNYFSCLSWVYATTPDRIHCCYQPVATFLNNVWESSMISRVIAFATTFWQLAESVRDYRLISFSTHGMSLQTLVDINYWCTSIVNEDSRQFFRAYFHYKGNFASVPIFMPVYMDTVYVKNVWGTWKNLYLQQQRWAYGVEHFPYIVLESMHQSKIPLIERIALVWRAYNGAFSWATSAFFITVVGWLPILLNNNFREQVAASNFPLVTSYLLTITWIGTIVANFVSLKLLPPLPKHKRKKDLIPMVLQWALVPVCTTLLGALPGIDAVTRLMLGKYMGFRVTEKKAV